MTVRSLETSGDLRIPGGIVIVGAGAVGIAMAVSLARRGQRVTLLEGGPHDPPFDFERRNEGPGTGRFHQGLRSGRMKAFGGTTRLWGGQLVPFDRGDFTARDAEGQPLWPISYEAFAPWVTRAYELLGVPAEARDTAAIWARATGLEMTLGDRLRATMNVWLRQPDFTKLFARELEGGALIDVITDARLATIEFAQDGRVEQVEVVAPSGKRARLRPDRLVLAHGTVEIAGTLLRAQQAAPHCPFAANPHVGAWFIDHLHGFAGSIESDDPARLAQIFDNVYFKGRKYNVKVRSGGEARGAFEANAAATINPAMTVGETIREAAELARRTFGGRASPLAALREGARSLRIVAPAVWRYLVRRRATGLYGPGLKLGLEFEQLPDPESRIVLDPASPAQTARAGVHWHVSGRELPAIKAFCEDLAAAFAEQGFGTVTIDPRILAEDPAFLDDCHDASHHMGGARMSASAERGVVDADCRVFGTSNLYVGGAAVFPSGSFANPTLSALALGLRLADHIASQAPADDGLIGRLVFGTGRLAGGVSARSSGRLLEAALDAGVRHVDCAPPYGMGTAEDLVGAVLRRRADSAGVRIIAKAGLPRPPAPLIRTALRAAKRLVVQPKPGPQSDWRPEAPGERLGHADLDPVRLAASIRASERKLGRIDFLLFHEAGPGEIGAESAHVLASAAQRLGARPGYGWGAHFDEALDARFPSDYVAECAISPGLLSGRLAPPRRLAILHSIPATAEYLSRCDPRFAAELTAAAALVPAEDPATARIAAAYALAAIRAPEALLVFSSTHEPRLRSLLAAFLAIDERRLLTAIAAQSASSSR